MTVTTEAPAATRRNGSQPHGGSATLSRDGARTVVWLQGEHDIATGHDVTDALIMAICTDDADVVVDLSGVTFLSAATIGSLLRGRYVVSRLSRRFALRSPSRCAVRLLDVTGLTFLVEGHPSV